MPAGAGPVVKYPMKSKQDQGWIDAPPFSQDKIVRGRHAEDLLGDALLQEAFEHVKNLYRASFENAPRGDVLKLQVAHASLAAIKDVEGALRAYLHSARLIEHTEKARLNDPFSPGTNGY